MNVTIEIHDWMLEDIKRLISEGTRGPDGQLAVVRDNTWPHWIGAAVAHFQVIVEQVEKARSSRT